MLNQAIEKPDQYLNGINVTEFGKIVDAVRAEPDLVKFQFRATNRWHGGGLNQSTIRTFYGAGEEQGVDSRHFTVDAGEPPALLGNDEAPNPAEFLLHALAACLTSTLAYKAAQRGITIESIESSIEGDMNGLKFLGISDAERTGFRQIRVRFRVKADASPETLQELAVLSPVYDTIVHGSPVAVVVEPA